MQIKHSPNSTRFTGTIPVRVFIDGMETFSEKEIKTASRQLTTILTGPLKNNEENMQIAKKFARRDGSYNLSQAINGLKRKEHWIKSSPSDFFRVIKNKFNQFLLFTGPQGEEVAKLGEKVGKAKAEAKERNCTQSFDVVVAQKNYEHYLLNTLKNLKLRITEHFDPVTKIKQGEPVELNILMTSNKKYGQKNFKMKLSDINFTRQQKN